MIANEQMQVHHSRIYLSLCAHHGAQLHLDQFSATDAVETCRKPVSLGLTAKDVRQDGSDRDISVSHHKLFSDGILPMGRQWV
jgi:hypothetical protein